MRGLLDILNICANSFLHVYIDICLTRGKEGMKKKVAQARQARVQVIYTSHQHTGHDIINDEKLLAR